MSSDEDVEEKKRRSKAVFARGNNNTDRTDEGNESRKRQTPLFYFLFSNKLQLNSVG